MESLEKNFYIRIIAVGQELQDGFTEGEIFKAYRDKYGQITKAEAGILRSYLAAARLEYGKSEKKSGNLFVQINVLPHGEGAVYTINLDATFHYIEYQELKMARQDAAAAKKYASWAIGVAITGIAVSVILEMLLKTQPIFYFSYGV